MLSLCHGWGHWSWRCHIHTYTGREKRSFFLFFMSEHTHKHCCREHKYTNALVHKHLESVHQPESKWHANVRSCGSRELRTERAHQSSHTHLSLSGYRSVFELQVCCLNFIFIAAFLRNQHNSSLQFRRFRCLKYKNLSGKVCVLVELCLTEVALFMKQGRPVTIGR